MRLIDADALIYNEETQRKGCAYIEEIFAAPTVEPTLYGYNLKHLALIAHEMEEKGITADKAAEIFADASAVVQLVIEEQKSAVEEAVRRWMT